MEFLKDVNGQMSTMRIIAVMIVGIVMLGWLFVSIRQGVLVPMPSDQLTLIGMAIGGKALQRLGEKKE